jgi:uncharacterized protein with ParB-like and HNH nuclease domain
MEIFDSTKKRLLEILADIQRGKIQLPDFQRSWVWDDNRIKGLIASVIKSFPISVVTLLETGNDTVHFKPGQSRVQKLLAVLYLNSSFLTDNSV